MGHKRLGDLPNTGGWKRFKAALGDQAVPAQDAADAALRALARRLPSLHTDPGLSYSFWLLSEIVWRSRDKNYLGALRSRGIDLGDQAALASPAAFISGVSALAQTFIDRDPNATVFAHIGQLALRETLTRELTARPGLFAGSGIEVQAACRDLCTSNKFGGLAARYFGTYLSRLLRYFIDREVPSHVGPDRRFHGQDDLRAFQTLIREACDNRSEALEGYFRERAKIVESYAGQYGSLHTFQDDLNLKNIRGRFLPYALTKLHDEIVKAERITSPEVAQ